MSGSKEFIFINNSSPLTDTNFFTDKANRPANCRKNILFMQKLFVLFTFLCFATFSANAQSCNPAACKKAQKNVKVEATQTNEAAVKLAAMEENIETRTCPTSGKVSFVRKDVCATSGTVKYSDVEYCTKSAKFVNVSPSAKASCSKSAKTSASCSAKKGASAKNVSAETPAKKTCCAGKSASGCAKGAKTTEAAPAADDAKVKLISNKN